VIEQTVVLKAIKQLEKLLRDVTKATTGFIWDNPL
jgi:hypothetical protein